MKRVRDGNAVFFYREAIAYRGQDCLEWPYGKSSGYGALRINGRSHSVSRLVCSEFHGPPPTADHQAAHSCGNRACVNPLHIRWATQTENEADKVVHGTRLVGVRNPLSRLTDMSIREIRAKRECGTTLRLIAEEMGLGIATVHRAIHHRQLSGE